MNEIKISDLIVFQNHQFVVANKPVGMPVQADPTNDMPLITLLEQYCKVTLLPINRIDRPVSGLVLLAKTKAAAAALNEQFRDRTAIKIYIAATKNTPEKLSDELIHFIKKGNGETNISKAFAEEKPNTERAVLRYDIVGKSENYTFWKIRLLTGRHHQIRAQLAAIGCPVKGDVKYGARRANHDRSIHLHAYRLEFKNPGTNEHLTFEAPLPDDPVWQSFYPYKSIKNNGRRIISKSRSKQRFAYAQPRGVVSRRAVDEFRYKKLSFHGTNPERKRFSRGISGA